MIVYESTKTIFACSSTRSGIAGRGSCLQSLRVHFVILDRVGLEDVAELTLAMHDVCLSGFDGRGRTASRARTSDAA